MNDHRQITPTLRAANLGLIVVAAMAAVCFVLMSRSSPRGGVDLNRRELFACGCVYGLTASACWLATAIGNRYLRLAFRTAVVIGAVVLYGLLRELRSPIQNSADFFGLCLVQCLLFHLFQVPRCRLAAPGHDHTVVRPGKSFSIADLGIATAGFAIVLAMIIRFSPTIELTDYWLLTAGAWAGGALISACLAIGMTSKREVRGAILILAGLALAVVGTYAIAVADSIVDEGQVSFRGVESFASFYGRIADGYVGTFFLFTVLALISPPAKVPGETTKNGEVSQSAAAAATPPHQGTHQGT